MSVGTMILPLQFLKALKGEKILKKTKQIYKYSTSVFSFIDEGHLYNLPPVLGYLMA